MDEDTIAADVVEHVGIGGNFISEEHTVEYMHSNYWPSKLFNRDSWDSWVEKGSKDVLAKAHEYVQSVLASYYPPDPVISGVKLVELEYIVKCAKEELGGNE